MTGADTRVRERRAGYRRPLLTAGILFIAFNLRPTLASVGPLVDQIQAETGVSHAALGLLTTLPLLAFAFVSNLAPAVTAQLGFGGALAVSLGLIATGGLARAFGSPALLFGGTALLGIGIALGNVLLPALVKRDFAHRSGFMTSMYSSVMAVGATIAAAISFPLSVRIGWRGVLAAWALPAVLALSVWLPQLKASPEPKEAGRTISGGRDSIWRSRLAWEVAAFMGLQSMTFYVLLAWLPDLLQDGGMTPATAGFMLALSQATGIAGSALVPVAAGRLRDQRGMVWLLGVLEGVALTGLIYDAVSPLTVVWVAIIGVALGGTFGLALLFLVLRSPDTETTTRLSGMAQSIGYAIAAVGPVIAGFLFDLTARWLIPMLFLVLVWVAKVSAGLRAGSARTIGREG